MSTSATPPSASQPADPPAAEAQEPVEELTLADGHVTLLGTAHVSRASAEKVAEMLGEGSYDAVGIELCRSRHQAIIDPDALAKMDLFQVIRQGKASVVAASLALGAFQQRLAEQFDIEPGAEMRAAIDVAAEKGIPVLLIDRDVGITLKRCYHNVPWWKRFTLIAGLGASVFSRETVEEEDIERLKQGDMLETAFSQLKDDATDLYEPLIDERDHYMAARLTEELPNHAHILAVVGAGHLKGIKTYLQSGLQEPAGNILARLNRLPERSRWPKVIPWVIVALILTGFALGFSRSSGLGWQLVADWVLINGGLSALGAAIAGGHILTILGAFVAAPLTSLNPTIGAGVVTAGIEVIMRKPRVGDFSTLRTDTTHFSGWRKNRVARTLAVFVLSTLGSAAGTYIAGFRIFEKLAG